MLISPEYREINRWMLANKNYGVSGHRYSARADVLARGFKAQSLLDYGCGRGYLAQNLPENRDYRVFEYDPGIPGKDSAPERADLVCCTDVLEHIEPDCLDSVLDDLFQLADKAVLLVIATAEASKHLPDGRNAHLIVENTDWWLPKLISRWQQIEFVDFGEAFIFIGMPRCKPH